MAKAQERKLVRLYYVDHGKTAKEAADIVGVTEKTVGRWVEKYGWRKQRDEKSMTTEKVRMDIDRVIGSLAEKRLLMIEEEADSSEKAIAILAQELSYWTKARERLDKDHRVPLRHYVEVQEDIFKALQSDKPELFQELAPWLATHIQNVSKKYD